MPVADFQQVLVPACAAKPEAVLLAIVEDFGGEEADVGCSFGQEVAQHVGGGEGVVVEHEGVVELFAQGVADAGIIPPRKPQIMRQSQMPLFRQGIRQSPRRPVP